MSISAQDIILFKDSSTVKAKVIEITDHSLIYARFVSNDSVVYSVNINSIAAVYYENGQQEIIEKKEQNSENQSRQIFTNITTSTPTLAKKFKKGGVLIKIGVAHPLGNWAAASDITESSYGVFGGDAVLKSLGNAGTGFFVGFDADIPLTKFGLGAFISLDMMVNPLQKKARQKIENDFTNEVEQTWGSSFVQGFNDKNYKSGYVKVPLYFNFPFMAGLRYTYSLNPKHRLFADAGIGCNVFNASTLEGNATFELDEKTYSLEEYYNWKNVSLTFCYRVGLGTILWNHFSIDLHYYGFGNGSMNYKYQRTAPNEGVKKPISETATIRSQMITFGIGYYF